MYNLLVKYSGWAEGQDTIPASRVFEYTDQDVKEAFAPQGKINFERVLSLPCLFLQESDASTGDEIARVGTIFRATSVGADIRLEYVFDGAVAPVANKALQDIASDLKIDDWEFRRTHWAIKNADFFRALMLLSRPRRLRPRVFTPQRP